MTNLLVVPIYLDGLVLDKPTPVVEAFADFSRLPYFDFGLGRQINPDVPYLSEDILFAPLQDEGLYLEKGIHLHWSLPFALTRALQTPDGLHWPDVPNRWLVTRPQAGHEKQWIVESNYLYPEGPYAASGSVTFPVDAPDGHQPYRYLGRRLTLDEWLNLRGNPEYLDHLTSVGYGDPNFAAFYPNSRSVFGFHDPDVDSDQDWCYDVIGWYADPAVNDFLHPHNSIWLNHAFKAIYIHDGLPSLDPKLDDLTKVDRVRQALNLSQKYAALTNAFKWVVSTPDQGFPERLICYARLSFQKAQADTSNAPTNPIKIAVGNTAAEALSAYLAKSFGDADKPKVEDQINAVLLQSEGKKHLVDRGYKFREARHEKGFAPFAGGTVWTIRPQTARLQGNPPDEPTPQGLPPAELADALAKLDALNQLQKRYDRACDEAEDLRRLLYTDWCKYQRCAYPPEDNRFSYPSPDEVRYFIENHDLPLLQKQAALANALGLQVKNAEHDIRQSLQTANAIITNRNEGKSQPSPTYNLHAAHGPRFWRASDPVLLLAGPGIRPTARHGGEQKLPCRIVSLTLAASGLRDSTALKGLRDQIFSDSSISRLQAWIKSRKDTDLTSFTGDATWTMQPWNPFLLEWEVELQPVEAGSNIDRKAIDRDPYGYAPDYITRNFELDIKQADLTLKSRPGGVTHGANIYSGRSILSPHSGRKLSEAWDAWLKKQPADSTDPAYFNIKAVYNQLTSSEEYYQSQSLGGFHRALLMQEQTLQLEVKDPLAFKEYKSFADEVASAVGASNRTAPKPLNEFTLIRTGVLSLLSLRLVDTFGQTLTLVKAGEVGSVITAKLLTLPESPRSVYLPPRLAQPDTFSRLPWGQYRSL